MRDRKEHFLSQKKGRKECGGKMSLKREVRVSGSKLHANPAGEWKR